MSIRSPIYERAAAKSDEVYETLLAFERGERTLIEPELQINVLRALAMGMLKVEYMAPPRTPAGNPGEGFAVACCLTEGRMSAAEALPLLKAAVERGEITQEVVAVATDAAERRTLLPPKGLLTLELEMDHIQLTPPVPASSWPKAPPRSRGDVARDVSYSSMRRGAASFQALLRGELEEKLKKKP